jgi:hypothetical protein
MLRLIGIIVDRLAFSTRERLAYRMLAGALAPDEHTRRYGTR